MDGGRIIWLVQNFGVKIITPSKTYDANDILLMYVEFAMSNQFITDLKKNTARGIEDKLRAGHAPILAPVGYFNDITKKQGLRDILPDPERFELVRKMWNLLLSRAYSPVRILDIATNEWGLRQRDGTPISRSKIYELFRNIFYTGQFTYQGKIYQGAHKQMITLEEFDLAQRILGLNGNPRTTEHTYSYTRLFKCACGRGITAHERYRKVCPSCHYKYNAEKNNFCPRCKVEAPEKTWYCCYYYCSDKDCPLGRIYIKEKDLEAQIDKALESIYLPQDFVDWTLKQLRKAHDEESTNRQAIDISISNTLGSTKRKLDNLLSKYLSDANSNGELISDEEYKQQKALLQEERDRLEEQLNSMGYVQDNWLDIAEKVFHFATHARYWFNNGTKETKRSIVAAIGMNLILDNRLVRCDMLKPFETIKQGAELLNNEIKKYEPKEKSVRISQLSSFDYSSPVWGG